MVSLKKRQIKALKDTIKVWEVIAAEKPRKNRMNLGFWSWKYNRAAKALGLPRVYKRLESNELPIKWACPLCEEFYETSCPLGICLCLNHSCEKAYAYDEWKDNVWEEEVNDQKTAKIFLKELKRVLKKLEGW